MDLNLNAQIPDPDGFYEELIAALRGLSDADAALFNAKLVLILANHVGDRELLREAMALARDNTLAHGRT
jgi:hypothetical protein